MRESHHVRLTSAHGSDLDDQEERAADGRASEVAELSNNEEDERGKNVPPIPT